MSLETRIAGHVSAETASYWKIRFWLKCVSFLAFNKQSLLHVQALGFLFFHWKSKQSCTVSIFQMPDPQQGLGSPGTSTSHGASRRRISRWMHEERPKPPETKSNPGKRARRDQHPLLGCWVCSNSRQFFGCLIPKPAILMFLRGKTLTFSQRKILVNTKQWLWIYSFVEGKKELF